MYLPLLLCNRWLYKLDASVLELNFQQACEVAELFNVSIKLMQEPSKDDTNAKKASVSQQSKSNTLPKPKVEQ